MRKDLSRLRKFGKSLRRPGQGAGGEVNMETKELKQLLHKRQSVLSVSALECIKSFEKELASVRERAEKAEGLLRNEGIDLLGSSSELRKCAQELQDKLAQAQARIKELENACQTCHDDEVALQRHLLEQAQTRVRELEADNAAMLSALNR